MCSNRKWLCRCDTMWEQLADLECQRLPLSHFTSLDQNIWRWAMWGRWWGYALLGSWWQGKIYIKCLKDGSNPVLGPYCPQLGTWDLWSVPEQGGTTIPLVLLASGVSFAYEIWKLFIYGECWGWEREVAWLKKLCELKTRAKTKANCSH